MNLLVTGGAGFIGSNLVSHIIDRPQVAKLVNLDCLTYAGRQLNNVQEENHPKYVFENVNLQNQVDVQHVVETHDITHVMHLAAETHVDRSISDPGIFVHSNIVGTYNLLESCRRAWTNKGEGYRFHLVSTDEVYGSLGEEGQFDESTAYAPSSPYSASKASADMLAKAYHRTYGLPVLLTNCSNNYGPRQHAEKLLPTIIRSVLERRPIPIYGDGGNVRDWLYVMDHVEALWQVLIRGRIGETYCIGGQCERNNLEMARQICDLFDELYNSKGKPSRDLIQFVKDRPGHDFRYAINAEKIRRELGWSPRYSLSQGLAETVEWYIHTANSPA